MSAIVPFIFLILAETPFDEWAQSPEEQSTIEKVWQVLEKDDLLNREFFAYVSHLNSTPSLAHVEKSLLAVHPDNSLLTGTRDLEEALFKNDVWLGAFAAAQTPTAYDRNYRIDRVNFKDRAAAYLPALTYLKLHPQQRKAFLRNPTQLQPTPRELRALRDQLLRDADMLRELRNAFRAVDTDPRTASALQDWWSAGLAIEGSDLTDAIEQLNAARERNPNTWDLWTTRNRSWAAESPDSLISAMYLQARIRRENITPNEMSSWTQLHLREPGAMDTLRGYLYKNLGIREGPDTHWPLSQREPLPELALPETGPRTPNPTRRSPRIQTQSPRQLDRNTTSRPSRPERPSRDSLRRPKAPAPPKPSAPP